MVSVILLCRRMRHGDPGVPSECGKKRGVGAPHAVRLDLADPGGAAAKGEVPEEEVPEEVARFVGSSIPRGDDQARVMPGLTGLALPGGLLFGVELDCGD